MNPIPTTNRPSSMPPATRGGDRPPQPSRPSTGARVLGWTLLTMTLGLVSCQAMFTL